MSSPLNDLLDRFKAHGAATVLVKRLAENDNSKNQIYLGGNFEALNLLPVGKIETDNSVTAGSRRERAKASVQFYWLTQSGISRAPTAQLILYPKYPEVRLSGLLLGAQEAPASLIASRIAGRLLFLAPTDNDRILAFVTAPDDPIANEFNSRHQFDQVGVFFRIAISNPEESSREALLEALQRVSHLGVIPGQRRLTSGAIVPNVARNAGGTTLEAVLGIAGNSLSEPDFLGWELKQYGTTGPPQYRAKSALTLMTPEPTGGIYKSEGINIFMERYGYADRNGIVGRVNFGGIYAIGGGFNKNTGLKLVLSGESFGGDGPSLGGRLQLVDSNANVAAEWKFSDLLAHWNRKHSQAAYVPSTKSTSPSGYTYGPTALLCQGTDFLLFLSGLQASSVYLDPGIKQVTTDTGTSTKKRNQFRVKMADVPLLYRSSERVTLIESKD